MSYLLDADVFMQAKNLHYGFDFCPGFWEWVDTGAQAGHVLSIEKVRDELLAVDDELARWAEDRDESFFLKPDAAVIPSLRGASNWANTAGYTSAGVNVFLQAADYYLVAHAHAHQHVVVTHEKPSSSVNKIKIPDACIGLDVKCMSPFEMLRVERARFVLGP